MSDTTINKDNSRASITFEDGGNYLEIAEKSSKIAEEYSNKLFNGLLLGSGVAFLTLGGFLAGNDVSSKLQSLYLFSLWYFAIALVLTFISGFVYSMSLALMSFSQRNLHNAGAFQRVVNQAISSVGSMDQFDDDAIKILDAQKLDIQVFQRKAKKFNKVSILLLKIHAVFYCFALLFFILGVFTPLISISIFDYF